MKKLPVLSVVLSRRSRQDRPEVPDQPAAPTTKGSQIDPRVFGRRLGLLSRLVGCSHREVSRPFVEGSTGYKTCLSCGARSPFNPKTFETDGRFYAPPVNRA